MRDGVPESWPDEGRVGRCTAGAASGSYILLWREKHPEWWTFYLSEPTDDTGEIDGYVKGDDAMEKILRDWQVVWLPPSEDTAIEREVFGIRDELARTQERRGRLTRWLMPWSDGARGSDA